MKRILYFDTTTDWIVVGLYLLNEFGLETIYLEKKFSPREASRILVKEIQRGLNFANWEYAEIVTCARGPGSFTGIRISVTTARDLAQIWNVPVLGLNSLEVYANYYFGNILSNTLAILDAKMKKVFALSVSENSVEGPWDIEPNELVNKLDLSQYKIYADIPILGATLLSEDFPDPAKYIIRNKEEFIKINIKEHNYISLTPLYMRGTYAEGKQYGNKNHTKIH